MDLRKQVLSSFRPEPTVAILAKRVTIRDGSSSERIMIKENIHSLEVLPSQVELPNSSIAKVAEVVASPKLAVVADGFELVTGVVGSKLDSGSVGFERAAEVVGFERATTVVGSELATAAISFEQAAAVVKFS
ncbi:hypothetical protein F0562_005776 [Nyssa sinensis]|uniref:Uncharacterized protein n=1 Tax=Nyssa sinensis TaxID=561372 RepID=A0A5J5ANS4_9ASTE|nr:hypothetical protein F0562_005776 [Nyssa sinensis]